MVNATRFPYNLENVTNVDNVLEFVQGVNNLTGQYFMVGMLFAGFIVLFTTMRDAGNKEALMGSGFIITVLSILFFALEFISTAMLTIIIIAFGVIFLFIMIKKD